MNAIIRPDTCRTCAHKFVEGNGLICRRHPPVVQALIANTQSGPKMAGTVTMFPKVEKEWTCGEHRAFTTTRVMS